ncbi:hypothetical protein E0Z10_g1605 [Xylaria hypoxylon]|uniref:Condensation domain-containing protein n=1 Tax=Xylaria hypoxylon TaxID=37992 RepID=A0A4Z0YT41_9PEZI|nr:hypothetical protein E0Z10_g1605 [Xylaria hypoxylon]
MTTPTDTATPREDNRYWVPLNSWNQLAPRTYNRFVLCFKVDNDSQTTAIRHLESCVVKLGKHRPVLRSFLKVNAPIALISTSVQHNIPVEVHDVRNALGKSYAHLKEAGFPASAFVHQVFEVPAGDVAHALILRIYTLDGGLVLGIHLHHSLGDGKAIDDVVSWLSAETRGDLYDTKPVILSSPFYDRYCSSDKNTDGYLLDPEYISQRSPERRLISSPAAQTPSNCKLIGKIFVFKIATLNTIQGHMQQLVNTGRPSTSVILIAFLWAHTAKARTAASHEANDHTPTSTHDEQTNGGADYSRLLTIVDARNRVFEADQALQYFGNAVETALASLPTTDLLKTCNRPTPGTDPDVLAKHLEPIVRGVHGSFEAVDQDCVRERYELYASLRDPRKLALDHFPDDSRTFVFNSWRYLGMNAGQEWNITGTDGVGYPDAIRRAGDKWNWPAVMILPTPPGSRELEVMITVDEGAMELLLKDEGLMGFVDRVVS